MKDIRIISGKKIVPSVNTVLNLLGCKSSDEKQEKIKNLFEQMSPAIQMRLRPKAAFLMEQSQKQDGQMLFYAILTIGDAAERLVEKYMADKDAFSAMVINAMADSCLFEFERGLLPIIRKICLEEGYGIEKRLEIPKDLPMETQKTIYDKLEAKRTLGLSITEGYMLSPMKSMCLVFELTEDTAKENLKHHCKNCKKEDCTLRQEEEPDILIQVEVWRKGKFTGIRRQITCPKGTRLIEALQKHEIFLPAYCGGSGACGKCRVRLIKGSLSITPEDRLLFSEKELRMGIRLACKAIPKENVTISLVEQEEVFFAVGKRQDSCEKLDIKRAYKQGEYGMAIDIGTTTLAFALVDMQSGSIVDSDTRVNSQRKFGADVISRIQASNHGRKAELSESIKMDICSGIDKLAEQNLSGGQRICSIVIAGNTVMLHLLREYSCQGFCKYPFEAETLALEELEFESIFGVASSRAKQAKVTLLPGISAFVGADITAGLFSCHLLENNRITLFLDLGTNGEMALCAGNRLAVASTAAGPVFEGGAIQWGTGSVSGAISKVKISQNQCKVQTIGEKQPIGICGTGVIETTAELLLAGIINQTGKLSEPYFSKGYPLAQTPLGEWIKFTQKDIREVQMAKAAIRTGIEILLLRMGVCCEEIDCVYLAGGFGYFLDVKKAAAIGILPEELIPKTKAVGNTALSGALLYLANQEKRRIQTIAEHAKEIVLANDGQFQEFYYKNIEFF